jgi:hypothetical protein
MLAVGEPTYTVLSELVPVDHFLDDPVFTDVTGQGEIYTLFRVMRVTHSVDQHPDGWTHLANVARVREPAMGVAMLRIIDRQIEDSRVKLSMG